MHHLYYYYRLGHDQDNCREPNTHVERGLAAAVGEGVSGHLGVLPVASAQDVLQAADGAHGGRYLHNLHANTPPHCQCR